MPETQQTRAQQTEETSKTIWQHLRIQCADRFRRTARRKTGASACRCAAYTKRKRYIYRRTLNICQMITLRCVIAQLSTQTPSLAQPHLEQHQTAQHFPFIVSCARSACHTSFEPTQFVFHRHHINYVYTVYHTAPQVTHFFLAPVAKKTTAQLTVEKNAAFKCDRFTWHTTHR